MAELDLLVVGDCNPDLVLVGDGVEPRFGQSENFVDAATLTIGGSCSITACAAARLGLRTAFVGVVGDDVFGKYMLTALAERGVDVSGCVVEPGRPTGLSVVLSKGSDRATLTAAGAIDDFNTDMVDRDLLRSARHVHSIGYFASARFGNLGGLFTEARVAGLTTSIDPQGDPDGDWTDLLKMLSEVDVVLPNSAEARGITGVEDIDVSAQSLAERGGVVAIKFGDGGGMVARGDEVIRVPGVAIDFVDAIGAGDSFDAGFLYGWLGGWSLARSLALANVCGGVSCQAPGGTAAQPTLEEALSRLPEIEGRLMPP